MALQPRLLIVVHGLPPVRVGGAELVAWRTARILAEAGAPVAVFHPEVGVASGCGQLVRSEVQGVARYALEVHPGENSSRHARRAFSQVLALWRPDAVWIHHLSGLSLDVPEVALAESVPTAVTFHDYSWMCPRGQLVDDRGERCEGPSPARCPSCLAPGAPAPARFVVGAISRRWWRSRERRVRGVVERCTRLTSPSTHVARRHEAWIGPGVDVEVLANPATRLDRVPPPPDSGPLRVGYFGTLLPTKGIEPLLRAQMTLPPGTLSLQLHGPLPTGDRWREWRHRVRTLTARSGAVLAGPYAPAEVADRLAEVEVVVLPSTWEENAPVVLQEARAAGRVVVASDVGGIPEFVDTDGGAVLVPPGDVQALATILADVPRLRRLGRVLTSTGPPPSPPDDRIVAFARRLARR